MPRPDRPRVAYVLKMYPRLAETFILNEILAHEAAGLQLDIISLRPPIDSRFHTELGQVRAEVTYLPGPSVKAEDFWPAVCAAAAELPGAATLLDDGAPELAGSVYQAVLLARLARERGITHFHAHFGTIATTVARLASRMADVPYSFTAHAKDIFHETVEDADLRRKLRDAAAVVTVSDYNVGYLRDRFGADARVVRRIYNGLDLSEFPYAPPRDRPPRIIGVGRLVEKKGFAYLIEACLLLARSGREISCEIIGTGEVHERLAHQVTAMGAEGIVELPGSRPRVEVVARMREAAVLAAPCVISPNGNRDGLPTVLLEAMALGTPCVSTDVTGIPEIVRHEETGLICRQRDAESLAEALARLLDERELGLRLAANARRLVEAEFDIHRGTAALREIFGGSAAGKARVALEAG